MVLLLRLRQICCHPCLVTEDGNAFVKPGEFDSDKAKHSGDELSRARYLVSPAFVEKMISKLKEVAMNLVKEEKEVVTICSHEIRVLIALSPLMLPPTMNALSASISEGTLSSHHARIYSAMNASVRVIMSSIVTVR